MNEKKETYLQPKKRRHRRFLGRFFRVAVRDGHMNGCKIPPPSRVLSEGGGRMWWARPEDVKTPSDSRFERGRGRVSDGGGCGMVSSKNKKETS
jgi:hypothetical protein